MKFEWDDNEFEALLQREANQHRMYPSDRVWRNIRSEVHGYKRWHSLYISAFCIIVALTIATLLNNKPIYLQKLQAHIVQTEAEKKVSQSTTTKDYFEFYSLKRIKENNFSSGEISNAVNNTKDNSVILPETNNFIKNPAVLLKPATDLTPVIYIPENVTPASLDNFSNSTNTIEQQQSVQSSMPVLKNTDEHENADNFVKDFGFNLSYKAMKPKRWSFQYYIAPSVSYRKLNDQIVQDFSPVFTNTNSIQSASAGPSGNTLIRNRPGMGIEAGMAFMYNASNRIRFKFGIQYNLRQYYIETFQSNNDFANILLVENNRIQQNLRVNTRFNNKSGNYETEINNRIGQVAIPLGVQWDIIKRKHINFTAEASVQPSFTLSKNVYLLSTDYTNYVDGTNLLRRSNINTSIGFFASFPVGKNTIWQIGPQYRYQHLPTYNNKYPIKENLHDFGFRLGFIKSIGQ